MTSARADLPRANAMLLEDPHQMMEAGIAACNWHEYVSDIHEGLIAYATETLWPSLGKLAFKIREAGTIQLQDGTSIVFDPESPRHRTDMLVTHPESSRAHYLFVCHEREMSQSGLAIYNSRPPVPVDRIIEDIINPSAETKAFEADPANWRDPEPDGFIEKIGATALPLAPKEGFARFRPDRETPDIWWSGMTLNLRPNRAAFQNSSDELEIKSGRNPSDPYDELKLLATLTTALRETDLGDEVKMRNTGLQSRDWVQFGDTDNAVRISAGMRMIREADGMVTQDVIFEMDTAERRVFGKLLDKELDALRNLASSLRAAGVSEEGKAFECNDGRDRAWSDLTDGCARLHVKNQSGTFTMELEDDGSVRILKGTSNPVLIESLIQGETGLAPDMKIKGQEPDIRRVRERNGVLGSLTSVECQFEPYPEGPAF